MNFSGGVLAATGSAWAETIRLYKTSGNTCANINTSVYGPLARMTSIVVNTMTNSPNEFDGPDRAPRWKSAALWAGVALFLVVVLTAGFLLYRNGSTPPVAGSATTQGVPNRTGLRWIDKPDGRIVRVPDNNTVVIDLGVGDQLVQGMTFEVYDQQSGIPALGDGMREGDLPEGKASIEVIRMLPGYSECRVIRRLPGKGIMIGDLIVQRLREQGE